MKTTNNITVNGKTIGLIILFFALKSISYSQAKYFKGYVIMMNGDTLKGEIKKNPKREIDNYSKAAYRVKEGSDIKTFNPTKIKEYYMEGATFVSTSNEGEKVFMKRLSKGKLNLYELKIEVAQMNEAKVESEYYFQKEGGEMTKIKSGKFKKQMTEMMSDVPDIVNGLEKGNYTYENISDVFNAYNGASK